MALKLTFAVNVPVKGQRYSLNEQHEGSGSCIWHRISFNLCEVCGRKSSGPVADLLDQCTETWKRREAERNNNCRPYSGTRFDETPAGTATSAVVPISGGASSSRSTCANAPITSDTCHECRRHGERRIGEVRRKERTVAVVRDILEQHGGKTIEEW